ncbi:hypothetical protein [uncultured Paraglaciecola sp.]|uniref:hypothetical protein n=1 Tax=uncultured Paraglaciecola sp. TaxID=1765024 RepID=UPI0030D7C5B3|tara:strand:+ start:27041 stop:28015 length:975 start_codon:yes stop_codon:yes gene_type:complete
MLGDEVWDLVVTVTTLVFIASGIFGVSSILAVCAYSLHRKFVSKVKQSLNSVWIVVHAYCAFCATLVVTIWLSYPASLNLPFVFKHCHSRNCDRHIPAIMDSNFLKFLFVFFTVSMLLICWTLIKTQQKKLTSQINSLLRLSQNKQHSEIQLYNANIIEAPQPVLLNVGLLNPKLLISTQLTNSLAAHDVKLLLAYEYGKAKQFENFKVKLLQIVCLFWPSKYRSLIILDLRTHLHRRALNEIRQLLGSHKIHIPELILNNMANDVKQFVLEVNEDKAHPSDPINTFVNDGHLSVFGYLAILGYFICLVIVTSNLSHVLFELVG